MELCLVVPDHWPYGNSSIATVQMKLISQGECIVLPLGSPSWRSFMKPLTPIATRRAVTSSWKVTAGCVTQERQTLCQLIKLGEFWTRLVYLYPSCCECDFIFFNTLTTVLITSSLYFLQYDGTHKMISRSTTSSKEFFQRPNQRSGRGLSL